VPERRGKEEGKRRKRISGKRERGGTINGDEVRRERSLVNARENWLLNLAAGMSAAHPRSPSSGDLNPPLPSHDPFPQVQRARWRE